MHLDRRQSSRSAPSKVMTTCLFCGRTHTQQHTSSVRDSTWHAMIDRSLQRRSQLLQDKHHSESLTQPVTSCHLTFKLLNGRWNISCWPPMRGVCAGLRVLKLSQCDPVAVTSNRAALPLTSTYVSAVARATPLTNALRRKHPAPTLLLVSIVLVTHLSQQTAPCCALHC
jgi:hypothetical protein